MSDTRFSGPHGHDFLELRNCLSSFRDERFVFIPNAGNAGDNLINLGSYRFFDRIGLQYELGNFEQIYPDRVIICGGGGALVPHFSGSDEFLRKNHPVCKAMVLLPHTVRTYSDMISEMDERCHLFVREENSYNFVASHITRANLYQSHDMAFMLDVPYIRNLNWHVSALLHKGLLRPWIVMLLKFGMIAKLKGPTLHAIRDDIEGQIAPTHPQNIDLSRMFATGDMDFPHCANAAKALSTVIQAFQSVETDRLHIAILATILGLQVQMYDNNYGKNYDVFNNSIDGYFRNTSFARR